jgi:hypothetical protein
MLTEAHPSYVSQSLDSYGAHLSPERAFANTMEVQTTEHGHPVAPARVPRW